MDKFKKLYDVTDQRKLFYHHRRLCNLFKSILSINGQQVMSTKSINWNTSGSQRRVLQLRSNTQMKRVKEVSI